MITTFCPRCGSENPFENQFCGKCGIPLLQPKPAEPVAVAQARNAPSRPLPPIEPVHDNGDQTISGPSFLGLSDEPDLSSSYLLDEDVSAPHWGLYVFIAVLAAAGLFAWWQLGSNGLSGNRLAALVQEARGKLSQQKQEAAAVAPNANPAAAENAAAPSASTPASNAPGNASPAGPSGTANAATPPPSAAEIQNAAQKQNVPAPPAALSQTAAVAAPPSPAPRKAVRQPRATDAVDNTRSADAESAALLSNAQKYLYGDGVPQSCDRALGYLRQAVDNDSAKAKSTLGGLYATGHCAPLDRATAYRWFALALRQEPNNSYLSHDLEMLWNQMTPAEKQRAIHMTQ